MTSNKTKVAFFNNGPRLNDVYALGRQKIIHEKFELFPFVINENNFEEHLSNFGDIEIIFTTWGMPRLSEEQVKLMPQLKVIFHAAGSVKAFAQPFLNCGVRVVSAADANSEPVAEFCMAQILLATKGYFNNTLDCKKLRNNDHFGGAHKGAGVYGEKVAFISVGKITKQTMELLRPFNLELLAVSNYLSEEDCQRYNVKKVTLEEAFEQAYVISNHLPDRNNNKGVIDYQLLSKMRHGASFINTGRGAQVNEEDLIRLMKERSDLTALLDVTAPEPALPESEFYDVPNIHLSSHLAGSINDEYVRMADFVIEQAQNWQQDKALQGEVLQEALSFLA
ncbi:MAG: hydroxyacid dehydrogenase [Lentisphaeraceae bacterium]|nr:hydroxyacid dehydrogenase [Lentisphaeraceae bacterium]